MSYTEFQRATLFFDAKDYIGAAGILAPLAEAEPGNRSVAELLARSYFHSAQLGRAEAAFRRLIDLDPGNGWAYEALARTLERRGQAGPAATYRRLAQVMGASGTAGMSVAVTAVNLA